MKRLSLLVVFTLSILYSISIEAQDLPQVILPSPEAQAFAKYGNIPVNTYTGVPNINIPLYTIKNGDINVPISLSYHASGVKVDEDASSVGLGWILNAGGIISRSVYGSDDFANNYFPGGEGKPYINNVVDDIIINSTPTVYFSIPDIVQQGPTYSCSLQFMGSGDLIPYLDFPSSGGTGYGFEPDQFTFNFQGNSGKFVLKHNGDALLNQEQKIEIKADITANQDNGFTVRTDSGLIYHFKEGSQRIQDFAQNPTYANYSWNMEKITSPTTGREINFSYSGLNTNERIHAMPSISQTRNEYSSPFTQGSCTTSPTIENSFTDNIHLEKYLNTIDFDNGQVVFQYDLGRLDLVGARSLKSIKVYQKDALGNLGSTPIKEFQFEYEYFDSQGGVELTNACLQQQSGCGDLIANNKRLKLKKVYEAGKPGHVFTYYDEYSPSKFVGKGSFAKDHWGYYNGKGGGNLIPAFYGKIPIISSPNLVSLPGVDRSADTTKIKTFSLKEIVYPTGGKTEFLYESNTYDYSNSMNNNGASYRNSNQIVNQNPTQENKTLSHLHKPNSNGDGTVKETTFTLPPKYQNYVVDYLIYLQCTSSSPACDQVTSSGIILESPDGNILNHQDLCANGANQGPDQCSIQGSFTLAPGTYTIKTTIPSSSVNSIYANYSWLQPVDPPVQYGGGQRIAEIRDFDANSSQPINIKKFDYHYTESGIEKSYGKLMAKPLYENSRRNVITDCNQFMRSSYSSVSLATTPVGYDKVTITNGINGEFGRSIFEYRNQPDQIIYYDGFRGNYPSIPFNSNGSIEKQQDFSYNSVSNSFDIVREVINTYTPEPINSKFLIGINRQYYYTSISGNEPSACYGFFTFYPAMKINWIKLESSTETVFNLGSTTQGVTTQTDYEYGSSHKQLIKSTTTNSKGDILISENKYAEDLNNTFLISNHIHNIPLWQQQKVDGNIVSTTETIYAQTGLPLPTTIKTSKGTGNLEPRINFHLYDDKGNPLEVSKEDGVHISYIWGYNQTYPVAKIENATRAQIDALSGFGFNFHTGFEGLSTTQENTLRTSLPNAMISTYTYDPLIGVTSMTDPKGYTMYYEYDTFNRLEFVKDADGNLVSENKYHYKN